ncbi:subunit of TIM23 translocase complex [Acarospora aff. strigata]|nr:subunit of TIM23 translocase complex [Acarospora aff. strigata]
MPPMPTNAGGGGMRGPTTFDKLKTGAIIGGSVGLIMGFIFGGVNIMRFGAGPNGLTRTLGQYMAGSAATFGCVQTSHQVISIASLTDEVWSSFFMSIGSVIRTEGSPTATEAFARARRQPIIMPRQHYRRPVSV